MDTKLKYTSFLPDINGPEDVKKLNIDELKTLCDEIRVFLRQQIRLTGGHLASNLGIIELSAALVYTLDLNEDKLIYDVGHQSYAHKLLTGRYDRFSGLRSFGGISGFQSPTESPYDFFQTGHASTSISAAIGFARAAGLTGKKCCSVAVVGDGAFTGGMIYEALNDGGATELPVIVILNDNEMSIGKNVGVIHQKLSEMRLKKEYIDAKGQYHRIMSHIPGGASLNKVFTRTKEHIKHAVMQPCVLDCFGFEFLGTVDGNDLTALIHAIEYAKSQEHPVLIHAKTKKGLGDTDSLNDPEAFHSVPRDRNGKVSKPSSFSKEFGKTMIQLGNEDPKLVAVTAAMPGGTGLSGFQTCFPDRFIDVGIAEEHAVTMATAMAMGGARPVVALYSTFLQRAFDQLLNDAALQKVPLTLAIDRAGMALDDGITHNGIFDVGYLSLIPGIKLYAPSNYAELKNMLKKAIYDDALTAVRYQKGSEGELTEDCFEDGKTTTLLHSGKQMTVVSYGMEMNKAISVVDFLEKDHIGCDLFKINRIWPLDDGEIAESCKKTGRLLVIEDVVESGSVGRALAESLQKKSIKISFLHIYLPGILPHGNRTSLEKLTGTDVECILKRTYEELLYE